MDKKHPYIGLPKHQFWKKEPAIGDASLFDPIAEVPFKITKNDPVVTAGSCFAQHVARHLKMNGFNHLITEKPHPLFEDDIAQKHNFGMFSARYGNVYTPRQLKQLCLRAYAEFRPIQDVWQTASGAFIDPFRPQIQPGGYVSVDELQTDRNVHFQAIRSALETMSTFVFTLGLTECWLDPRDGAVFPIAPGVAGGSYDPTTVEFRNFSLPETIDDLFFAIDFVRRVNPNVQIILTVSPVPLNATYEDKHVWTSTVWSKAVLRLAAEEASKKYENCCYFPSYEIITSPYARGRYFGSDCREVTEEGVNAVMSIFIKHFCNQEPVDEASKAVLPTDDVIAKDVRDHIAEMEDNIRILCDEEAISDT